MRVLLLSCILTTFQQFLQAQNTCRTLQDSKSCEQKDNCAWVSDKQQGQCSKKGFDCSQFTSEQQCNYNFQCFYEEGKEGYCYNKSSFDCNKLSISLCKGNCVWLSSQDCQKKEQSELEKYCSQNTTADQCNNKSDYCDSEYACIKKQSKLNFCNKPKNECLAYKDICEYVQTDMNKCQYVQGFCENASTEICLQNSNVCEFIQEIPGKCINVSDNFCNQFSIDQCRQNLNHCNLSINMVCALTNDPCLQIKDLYLCKDSCSWDSVLSICKTTNQTCTKTTDLQKCQNDSNCFLYQNYTCTNKNQNVCTSLSSQDCNSMSEFCEYKQIYKTCYSLIDECIPLTQSNCFGKCKWNSTQKLCRSVTPTSCDIITNEQDCIQKIECSLLDSFTCTQKSDYGCSLKTESASCKSSYPFCYYQQQVGKCSLKKDPCVNLNDYKSCQNQASYCEFIYESGYCQFNMIYLCEKLTDITDCTNSQVCEYNYKSCKVKNTDFCVNKISIECDQNNSDIPCQQSKIGVCSKIPYDCSTIHQKDACQNENLRELCEWNDHIPGKCKDALDCSPLNKQQCDQISSYCKYDFQYYCIDKSELDAMHSQLLQALFFICLIISEIIIYQI